MAASCSNNLIIAITRLEFVDVDEMSRVEDDDELDGDGRPSLSPYDAVVSLASPLKLCKN